MASPITWRSVGAPDATGAAQILQMAGQNIGRGIDAFKGIAENQKANITDQNVSSLAQQIMGAGEGIDGIQQIDGIQKQLANVNAADIGGIAGLNQIMDMAEQKRTALETEAVGSFNEILANAKASGDFSKVNSIKDTFASSVRNAAPSLDVARASEATYNATNIINGINSGKLKATDVLADKSIDFSQPEMGQALSLLSENVQNAKFGSLIPQIPEFIEKVTTQGVSIGDVQKEVYANFTPEELARNYTNISSLMGQVTDAYVKASGLNDMEKVYVQGLQEQVSTQQASFEQSLENEKSSIARQYGADVQAISIIEEAKDLNMIGAIDKVLGETALDGWFGSNKETAQEKIQSIMQEENVSPAALMYAVQFYGELGDSWGSEEASFRATVKKAEADINTARLAWDAYDARTLARKEAFADYLSAANSTIGGYVGTAPRERMRGEPLSSPALIPFAKFEKDRLSTVAAYVTNPTGNTGATNTEVKPVINNVPATKPTTNEVSAALASSGFGGSFSFMLNQAKQEAKNADVNKIDALEKSIKEREARLGTTKQRPNEANRLEAEKREIAELISKSLK